VYFVAGEDNCCQIYGWLSKDGWTKNRPKNDIFLGSNSETIEGMDLKLMMLYYLFRHYAQTKFHLNPIGSRFFWVDLTWNDPYADTSVYIIISTWQVASCMGCTYLLPHGDVKLCVCPCSCTPLWTQTAQGLDWSRPASWPRRRHGTGRLMTVLHCICVLQWKVCLKMNWLLKTGLQINSCTTVDMSHSSSHIQRESLPPVPENHTASKILCNYLSDIAHSSIPNSAAAIVPGSDDSGKTLLEKMEPFILFGSSFPRDKEDTRVGALLWWCNGGKSKPMHTVPLLNWVLYYAHTIPVSWK